MMPVRPSDRRLISIVAKSSTHLQRYLNVVSDNHRTRRQRSGNRQIVFAGGRSGICGSVRSTAAATASCEAKRQQNEHAALASPRRNRPTVASGLRRASNIIPATAAFDDCGTCGGS